MARIVAIVALALSMVTYAGQIFLFTQTDEQILCGLAGTFVYAMAVVRNRWTRTSNVVDVSWALASGVILGLLPPRLRLGGAVGSFVLFFPLMHFVTLVLYFFLIRRDPSSSTVRPKSKFL
jgi:hypothetical protein